MLKKTILIDLTHNEMLNIEDEEFKEFLNLLKRLDLKVKKNENGRITKEILENIDLIIIGNPIDDFFSSLEIKYIVDHVRSGGGLLLLSEYGSDSLQKTNLNDIAGKFGIFFEKNLIKEMNNNNQNCTSILHIQDFPKNQITKNLREMIIGGTCSLLINKEVLIDLKGGKKNGKSKSIRLGKGFHEIEVRFHESNGKGGVSLLWGENAHSLDSISSGALVNRIVTDKTLLGNTYSNNIVNLNYIHHFPINSKHETKGPFPRDLAVDHKGNLYVIMIE